MPDPMTRPSDTEAAIARVLRENGIVEHPTTPEQVEQGIHSWRCGYPDTYGNGPCTCFAGLVEDLAALAGAGAQVTEAAVEAAAAAAYRKYDSHYGIGCRGERNMSDEPSDDLTVTVPIKRWQLVYNDFGDLIGLNDGSSCSYHNGIQVPEGNET